MISTFYNDFDLELFGRGEAKKLKDRTPFEQDRDRIIYSPAFRRLQNKTQVFLSGEYDFYRTRLTHSIEVSQIGRSICNHLNRTTDELGDDFTIDQNLVESICLAHDIGHPSFGHAGEAVLNKLMKKHKAGGFEGNAQNLRILVDIFYRKGSEWSGMKPTRAFLDGMLKYKTLFSDSKKQKNHFVYDSQEEILDFVSGDFRFRDEFPIEKERNFFKSIECQIMDWADDIAYSIHDVSDGIQAGFITIKSIRKWQQDKTTDYTGRDDQLLDELCDAMINDDYSRYLARLIGIFIHGTRLVRRETFLSSATNRYRFGIERDRQMDDICTLLKQMAIALVFHTPQVHQLEYKGEQILKRLFKVFSKRYVEREHSHFTLLPDHYAKAIDRADEPMKYRIICDYLSGMTDGFVVRTYKRLFDPDFGSIIDLV
ncbi:dGTP triphosphohydrolase [Salidesulfovibrio onnuriiensis]|uniref:dGTP triphosphohydrolase n=1 Tax=Salidesulfovibrio onnuriiensis TaxID=2583823 RepID=UPI0011CB3632|nr:dNTP triphosphohydrolase [Salidesulfovibrio onnuriiensis]